MLGAFCEPVANSDEGQRLLFPVAYKLVNKEVVSSQYCALAVTRYCESIVQAHTY